MLPPRLRDAPHRAGRQKRLIGHEIQNRRAVRELLRAEPDRAPHALLRAVVPERLKPVDLGQLPDLRLVVHDQHARKHALRHRLERAPDERSAAQLRRELSAAEAFSAAGRHDEAADAAVCLCHFSAPPVTFYKSVYPFFST